MNYPITTTERYVISKPAVDLIAEPLQNCLESVIRRIHKESAQIVMVTAAHRGAGVTTFCANLATLLSESHGTTLLADGEALVALAARGLPPRRAMYREIKPGYVWVLGASELAATADYETGPAVTSDAVMTALKEQFDYVVIDAPALDHGNAAQTLAGAVDGSLFVAVPYTTEYRDATAAGQALTAAGGRLLGAIYNTAFQQFGAGV